MKITEIHGDEVSCPLPVERRTDPGVAFGAEQFAPWITGQWRIAA